MKQNLSSHNKTLVFTATYNEIDNIGLLLDGVFALSNDHDVLVVDDSSKDGTTEYLRERAKVEPRLKLIVRSGKLGLGSAHKVGWVYARKHGYSRIVTMDADLSHDPNDIPKLLAALDAGNDAAIGSRFAQGGRLDYTGWRRFLSVGANKLSCALLGLTLTEYTTSFRSANLAAVPDGLIETIPNDSYAFFLSCMVTLARAKLRIGEVPIHFHDRHGGESKIPSSAIFTGAINLLRLTVDRRSFSKTRAAKTLARRPAIDIDHAAELPTRTR